MRRSFALTLRCSPTMLRVHDISNFASRSAIARRSRFVDGSNAASGSANVEATAVLVGLLGQAYVVLEHFSGGLEDSHEAQSLMNARFELIAGLSSLSGRGPSDQNSAGNRSSRSVSLVDEIKALRFRFDRLIPLLDNGVVCSPKDRALHATQMLRVCGQLLDVFEQLTSQPMPQLRLILDHSQKTAVLEPARRSQRAHLAAVV